MFVSAAHCAEHEHSVPHSWYSFWHSIKQFMITFLFMFLKFVIRHSTEHVFISVVHLFSHLFNLFSGDPCASNMMRQNTKNTASKLVRSIFLTMFSWTGLYFFKSVFIRSWTRNISSKWICAAEMLQNSFIIFISLTFKTILSIRRLIVNEFLRGGAINMWLNRY